MSKADKIRDKIRALKRKAKEDAQNESQVNAILAAAMRMAQQHGLSFEDIDNETAEADCFVQREEFSGTAHLHPVDTLMSQNIADFTACKVYRKGPRQGLKEHQVVFFGHEADVELAHFIRSQCISALDFGWDIHRRFVMSEGQDIRVARQSYCKGFAKAISDKMSAYKRKASREAAQVGDGRSLMVLKAELTERKFAELGMVLRRRSGRSRSYGHSHDAFGAGREQGRSVNIGRGMAQRQALRITKS